MPQHMCYNTTLHTLMQYRYKPSHVQSTCVQLGYCKKMIRTCDIGMYKYVQIINAFLRHLQQSDGICHGCDCVLADGRMIPVDNCVAYGSVPAAGALYLRLIFFFKKEASSINVADMIEGSLEVELPTIWTDEKHSQEETRTCRKSERCMTR